LLTYALSPLVELLHRWHLPRWIGAALILVGLFGGIGWTGYSLSGNASQLVDSLPVAAQKLGQAMRRDKGASATPLESVQQAAAQLEKAAEENSARVASRRGVARVIIERPGFNVRDYLLSGTVGLLSALGQFTLVAFLTYFALCSGDTFRRKLIKITGSSLQKKKVTVHVLDDITRNIERYLLVQILVSVVVGVATGLAFWAIGVENAAVWGIIAAVTNLIPYIGSVIVLAAAGLVAFLQFNSLQMGIVVAALAGHPHAHRQPADALAHQPHQPHEPGGGVRGRDLLGLALGHLGAAAGHSDHDGDQVDLRPGGRPAAHRRTAGRVGPFSPTGPWRAPPSRAASSRRSRPHRAARHRALAARACVPACRCPAPAAPSGPRPCRRGAARPSA
jgi:predicted PurR-regulated permease PerM